MKKLLLFGVMFLFTLQVYAQEQCKAVTLKGTQCTRKEVKDGYCKQHFMSVNTKELLPDKPKVEVHEGWQSLSTDAKNPDVIIAYRDPNTNTIHFFFKH